MNDDELKMWADFLASIPEHDRCTVMASPVMLKIVRRTTDLWSAFREIAELAGAATSATDFDTQLRDLSSQTLAALRLMKPSR